MVSWTFMIPFGLCRPGAKHVLQASRSPAGAKVPLHGLLQRVTQFLRERMCALPQGREVERYLAVITEILVMPERSIEAIALATWP